MERDDWLPAVALSPVEHSRACLRSPARGITLGGTIDTGTSGEIRLVLREKGFGAVLQVHQVAAPSRA